MMSRLCQAQVARDSGFPATPAVLLRAA